MKNKEKILEIIKTRKIVQLIHFTKKKNINSILKHGLLSIEELKKRNIDYIFNDPERRDSWNFSISLSITNKNSILLDGFKRRQKLNDNDFVEIRIDPSVIVENICIFCDTNAANHTFESYRQDNDKLNHLKIWPAFDGMFKNIVYRHYNGETGKIKRFKQELNETTCLQAEICLIGNISSDKFINYNELNLLTNG